MSKKKNKQRETNKGDNIEYKWEDFKEEEKDKKNLNKKDKKDEEVILMGAPRDKVKELPRIEEDAVKTSTPPKREAKSVKIDFGDNLEHTTASEEELKKVTNTKKTSPSPKEHTSLGKIFLAFLAFFVAYLIIGQILNMFGPTTVSLLALWPLLIIFVGLSLFKVKKRGLTRILAGFVVLIVFIASIALVFKGGDIVTIHTDGIVATEERGVDPFTSINFDGVGTLKITEGDREAVIISGDEAILGEVSTTVLNDTLVVKYNNLLWSLFLFEETSVDVEVIARDVSKIVISGKADVQVDGITGELLDLTFSGEGSLKMENLFLDDLVVRVIGKADVVVSGEANSEYVFITGSGSYDGSSLLSSETGVRISGAGDAQVNTENELNVSISGIGDVIYIGEPDITGQKITGTGSIMSEFEAAQKEIDEPQEEKEDVQSDSAQELEDLKEVTEEKLDDSEIVSDPEDFLKSLNSKLE